MGRDPTVCMGCGQIKAPVSGEDITDQAVRVLKQQLNALEHQQREKAEAKKNSYSEELSDQAIKLAKAIAHLSRERRGVLKDKNDKRKNMTYAERNQAVLAHWKSLTTQQRSKLFEELYQALPPAEQGGINKVVLGMRDGAGPTRMYG